ncbi:MAG: sulfotransferase [Planctomycetes bacterium]|nr:sulfotransferase [Planctomycetota bacterium]NOG54957.1 sulfotransferase [Planctomycetota bacterium]
MPAPNRYKAPGVTSSPLASFLVFACPKSGTTWMQRMLCAHPEVHCSESRAFGDFYNPDNPSQPHLSLQKYVSFLRWYHHGPVQSAAGEDGSAFYDMMLHEIVNTIARVTLDQAGTGKRVYGEKATPPSLAGACQSILAGWQQYNPGLCFVHLVRDPRDVAVSGLIQQYRDRGKQAAQDGNPDQAQRLLQVIEQQTMPQDELERWTALWQESVAEGLHACEALFPDHSLTLRYEDLLDKPGEGLAHILKLIGVSTDAATVTSCVEAASFEALSGGRARGCEDRGSFYRMGVAGDWQNWLTPEQTQWCAEVAGEVMQQFGYALS